ncbi:hypothetical protein GCM10010193_62020 [Kitasatospora atroaurantiaca]|uniref:hypothetical protein n=1 Tax=Kitasatospora atroaurantiaca TaxID=285545 RepID=UPI00119EFD1E|nr:hypothetical protein [Kitasatospora atroaurantiaca]
MLRSARTPPSLIRAATSDVGSCTGSNVYLTGRTSTPGGRVETHFKYPGGGTGCLTFITTAILLLLLSASCHR